MTDLRTSIFAEIEQLATERSIFPSELCFLGFTITIHPFASWNGIEHEFTYYPTVYRDNVWIWEPQSGHSWYDKGRAINEAIDIINSICNQ